MFIMLTITNSSEIVALAVIWVDVTITFSSVTRIDAFYNKLSEFLSKMFLPIYLCQLAEINLVPHFGRFAVNSR